MSTKNINRALPNCPLCKDKMMVVEHKKEFFFACTKPSCMVSINIQDPNVELWEKFNDDPDAEEEVICGYCGGDMHMFFRADGYMKSLCQNKKCQSSIETSILPDRFTYLKKDGEVI